MPELPEVETTRRGLAPHVVGRHVVTVTVRQPRLRWPVTPQLARDLPGRRIDALTRRAKYLLLAAGDGHLLMHLGMSGRLRIVPTDTPAGLHDHLDIRLDSGQVMRLNDPRRFGCALWLQHPPDEHALIAGLGPEPLSPEFSGDWLYARSRGRRAAVKVFIMDAANVVGVGNIYASEALFEAGIHPSRPAGRIGRVRYARLAAAIKQTLARAIDAGGTTLRDYIGVDGGTGWFQLSLAVYGREGQPCPRDATSVRRRIIGQRSTFFCPRCQI
ncbi:bifunctional DNA-formamidopyrimidine glycosylase/DNA-(apurinic or apyrimidinic site) lyase [Spectribacter hydrogenoxidans]|uniref:Formamidopyrimidine-DNA glycosylase n=1 Tax=Spectribacter hydrogenoxidans TaxID=3075608 RepID=A0ABU3BYM2_9GAMM|nr:bifunctional DNA-formamidopyrimidine glycosylase/DNA-(apurinic or apyrimidinic site) lyase [Salinisphaera sp. W335]MDT0634409.1 bifunctional DNA-formamidopyrimidine glycosylase/DNA-(apurinic or apyrimidinic site) lyase [Salinisphaera sp. W335]